MGLAVISKTGNFSDLEGYKQRGYIVEDNVFDEKITARNHASMILLSTGAKDVMVFYEKE